MMRFPFFAAILLFLQSSVSAAPSMRTSRAGGLPAPAVLFLLEAGEEDYLVLDLPLPPEDVATSYYAPSTRVIITTPAGTFKCNLTRQKVAFIGTADPRAHAHLQLYFSRREVPKHLENALRQGIGISLELTNDLGEANLSLSQIDKSLLVNRAEQISLR